LDWTSRLSMEVTSLHSQLLREALQEDIDPDQNQ
jgi:hypothetical protein